MADRRDARRDRAGLGPDPAESRRRLVSIDAVDGFKVASGEPDIRGWDVRTLSDRGLGEVHDLLIDPDRNEVVMLEVALHGNDIRAEVPVRSVQLDRDRKVVIVDSGDIEEGTTHRARASTERDAAVADEELRRRHAEESRSRAAEAGSVHADRAEPHAADRDAARRDADVERGLADDDITEERVVERRPIVEEVVVRRRRVDE